jgi:hypothetical protein
MSSKILFSVALLSLGAFALRAQESTVVYEKRLETVKASTLSTAQNAAGTPNVPVQEWVVVQRNKPTFDVQTYEVKSKGKNMDIVAIYNPKGVMLSSREVLKEVALPEAVSSEISARYPGWVEYKDEEIITKGKKEISHYVVYLKKEGKRKRIVYAPDGKKSHHA